MVQDNGALPEPGSVHVIFATDRARIVLAGEVDAELGPELLEAAADVETAGYPVEVDTHRVTFMDSSGVAFLARLAARSASRVLVIRPPETVRFLLEVTRISEILDITDTDPGVDLALPEGVVPITKASEPRSLRDRGSP